MKVKRAAQVFRNTVHAAILEYICSAQLPHTADHTANFVKKINSLIDIFNSSSLHSSKDFSCAMTENCTSLDYVQLTSDLLNKLIVKGLKVQPSCVQGWRQSNYALTML